MPIVVPLPLYVALLCYPTIPLDVSPSLPSTSPAGTTWVERDLNPQCPFRDARFTVWCDTSYAIRPDLYLRQVHPESLHTCAGFVCPLPRPHGLFLMHLLGQMSDFRTTVASLPGVTYSYRSCSCSGTADCVLCRAHRDCCSCRSDCMSQPSDHYSCAAPPGFEPEIRAPDARVLPVTPRSKDIKLLRVAGGI